MDKMNVLVVVPHDAALSEYISIFKYTDELTPIFYLSYKSLYIQSLENLEVCYYENKTIEKKIRILFLDI